MNRILPDRVLAAALALPEVQITVDCWISARPGRPVRCCALGLVALHEQEIDLGWPEQHFGFEAIEELLGISDQYRHGYDAGFEGGRYSEDESRDVHPEAIVGNRDGLAARKVIQENVGLLFNRLVRPRGFCLNETTGGK